MDPAATLTERTILRHGSDPSHPSGVCSDELIREEPLTLWLHDQPLVTLVRTPGHDTELVAGFLHTSGLIGNAEGLDLERSDRGVEIRTGTELPGSAADLRKRITVDSGGGWLLTVDDDPSTPREARTGSGRPPGVSASHATKPLVDADVVMSLPDRLFAAQPLFQRTGAGHGAALFTPEGRLLAVREDVGRHNAADKVLGWALLNGGIDLARTVMQVSSRASYDLVRKAARAGVRVFCAVSAPSAAAVDLAEQTGITLVGFSRGTRFNVYTRPERIRGV